MARTIAVGIDIGTHHVKVIAAENVQENGRSMPRIIGTGFTESRGLRHGYVVNAAEAVKSVADAVRQAEKGAGISIKKAYLSIGGVGLSSIVSQSSVIISRADGIVTDAEADKALESCESELPSSYMLNRKILHAVPISYKLDGKPVLGRPQGMKGMKLEVKAIFVTCIEQHLNDLIEVMNEAGLEVEDVMASPLAGSLVTLTKAQKIAGCVLANIGAETVAIAVFENNIPISLEVFPIGGIDITHDIALGLKIPIEQAEEIKKGRIDPSVSKRKLDEIVSARLSDIFELIETHLKKIGRNGLLPAGIILTGGGSGMADIEDIAKAALRIPSRIGKVTFENAEKNPVKDSFWAAAYGLCLLGCSQVSGTTFGPRIVVRTKNKFVEWVKQFLP